MRTRRRLFIITVIGAILVLAGCATGRSDDPGGPGSVRIDHALGSAQVGANPVRVVTLGAADTQIATALGAQVVGAVRNPSSPDGNWPGVRPALSPAVTVLDSVRPDVTSIAALHPDLILATTAQSGYHDVYDRLSRIAPTIAYFDAPLRDPGEKLVDQIGRALGRSEQAAVLRERSDRAIDEFTRRHAASRAQRVAFGQFSAGTTYLMADPESQGARFFSRLGLRIPSAIADMRDAGGAGAALDMVTASQEELGVLGSADVGLISVFGGAPRQFTDIVTVSSTSLARSGRLHVIPVDLAAVLLQPNPATTDYALSGLRPYLTGS
ncbi:ABC transporter substrate-binding protein [Gordonia soli]|uniref:Putative ABC transporter substrate-binding protein n=1 Tax=Gordonia soli NBRC 108243 TaxID=1223545 RepID=M0QEA0_9ACTN|nr:ABC transporter substrate-binding protein [Gordonia soli]GAC66908.1 putative ABC transporter substrate-binding protein [Gordonia soli NBRC 108243]